MNNFKSNDFLLQKLNSKRDSLNDCQKRLIDRYLLNGRMNGIHLAPEPRRTYMAIAVRLAEYKTHFRWIFLFAFAYIIITMTSHFLPSPSSPSHVFSLLWDLHSLLSPTPGLSNPWARIWPAINFYSAREAFSIL